MCERQFWTNVHSNMRCLLVMNTGHTWQQRLQCFPALATATQLQYIECPSQNSLQHVAAGKLALIQDELGPEGVARTTELCVELHTSACTFAENSSRLLPR